MQCAVLFSPCIKHITGISWQWHGSWTEVIANLCRVSIDAGGSQLLFQLSRGKKSRPCYHVGTLEALTRGSRSIDGGAPWATELEQYLVVSRPVIRFWEEMTKPACTLHHWWLVPFVYTTSPSLSNSLPNLYFLPTFSSSSSSITLQICLQFLSPSSATLHFYSLSFLFLLDSCVGGLIFFFLVIFSFLLL